jgi:S-formylglutathione hydrolase FrmB
MLGGITKMTGRRHRAIHLAIGCLAVVIATLVIRSNTAATASSCSAARVVTITIPDNGLIASQWLSYSGPPKADVLLPACYDPSRKHPLLLLLGGLWDNYSIYAQAGLTAAFGGSNAIVVMPEGGSGWYTDWWNDGERGGPSWETYELDDVVPYILGHYPILPQRRYHAIAGVSMGGLGATYLGGRLPGFFGSVATLSGFVDLNWNNVNKYLGLSSENSPVAPTIIDAGAEATSEPAVADMVGAATVGFSPTTDVTPLQESDYDPYAVFGPPDGFYFDGHDPTSLAANLKHTRVFESTGTGVPSSGDLAAEEASPGDAGSIAEAAAEEAGVIYPMSDSYHQALTAAGVDVTYQVHPGVHGFPPDVMNELKAMLAWGLFKPVVADPKSWVNQTVATSGQLWDISYRFDQPPSHLVQFRQSGSSMSISAAGSDVTITTAKGCVIHTRTPATVRISGGCSRERAAR